MTSLVFVHDELDDLGDQSHQFTIISTTLQRWRTDDVTKDADAGQERGDGSGQQQGQNRPDQPLDVRVPVQGPAEVAEVARAVNDLADALALTFALPDQPASLAALHPALALPQASNADYNPYDPGRW